MKKISLFMIAVLITAGALAQSDTTVIVLKPYPLPQGPGSHPVPMLMPSAFVCGDAVCVEFPFSTDMTLIVRKQDDDEIVETEYFYTTMFASIAGLLPDDYYLEVIIGTRTFQGEFTIQ